MVVMLDKDPILTMVPHDISKVSQTYFWNSVLACDCTLTLGIFQHIQDKCKLQWLKSGKSPIPKKSI